MTQSVVPEVVVTPKRESAIYPADIALQNLFDEAQFLNYPKPVFLGAPVSSDIFSLKKDVSYYPADMALQELAKDPDFNKTFKEIVIENGFLFEEHKVTTDDGYILSVFRIKSPQT